MALFSIRLGNFVVDHPTLAGGTVTGFIVGIFEPKGHPGTFSVARHGIVITTWAEASRSIRHGWRITGALDDGSVLCRKGM